MSSRTIARDSASGFFLFLLLVGSISIAAAQTCPSNVPHINGVWTTLPYLMPINPISATLMSNGNILIVSGSENDGDNDTGASQSYESQTYRNAVWNPTGTGESSIVVQNVGYDVFCAGTAVLPDGRPLVVGGTDSYQFTGDNRASIFDPLTSQFPQTQNMADGRWYATATALGNGSIITFSGLDETGATNNTVETYDLADASAGWGSPVTAPFSPPLFPRMELLPNGNVFFTGSGSSQATPNGWIFDPSSQTWAESAAITVDRFYGSTVILPLLPPNYTGVVMNFGGGETGTNSTETIDPSTGSPTWTPGPNMSTGRVEMNAVILPNGTVLAEGGSGTNEIPDTPGKTADIYNPLTNAITSAGTAGFSRLYHSTALLLPDATVMSLGSNPGNRGSYLPAMEIYTPSYLFGANDEPIANRPAITRVSSSVVAYDSPFTVTYTSSNPIASAVLMRPGSVTHSFNMDQRMIGLCGPSPEPACSPGSGTLSLTTPPNGNIAPPGYYMLFLLDSTGVPSKAQFIQLSLYPSTPPTATITSPASNVTIVAGNSVNFGTTSTSDQYSWVFPGGSPGTSTLQNPGNVTFDTPGTYVASLTVIDSFGNSDPNPPTVEITVLPSTPDFSIAVGPPAAQVVPGQAATFTVTITPENGFNGTVDLSVGSQYGFTAGITSGGFSPSSIVGSGTSTLTMDTTNAASPYALSLTVTGTSGTLTNTASTTLLVNLAPPTNLTATATNSQIALSWIGSTGASGYQVERSLFSGGPYIGIGCTTSTSLTDTQVVNGTNYYYVVAADYTEGTDGSGNSATSTEASAIAIVSPTPTPTSTLAPEPTPTSPSGPTPIPTPTSTASPSPTATPTPLPSPAHWWQFNDGAGPVAADSADSAPGALSGSASWVAGVDEQYAIAVGTSSYNGGAAVAFPTTLPTTFTFTFWVNPTSYTNALGGGDADNNVLFGGDEYATNGFRSGFTSTGIFSFWTTESGGTLSLNDTASISPGVWTWFAVTYSNNSANLYRNGALVATSSGTYIPSTTNLGLDVDVSGVDFYWGSVDDTRIYNTVLSASQILSLYQSIARTPTPTPSPTSSSAPTSTSTPTASVTPAPGPTPSPTSTSGPISTPTPTPTATLAHWWKFTDGSGTVAADSADSAPGTLAGSASWVTGVDEQYAISVGTSSYNGGGSVTFPTNLPTAFTFSFWVEPSGYTNALGGGGAYNNVLFGGGQYATNGFRSGFTSAGTFSFWTTESGGTLTLNDTTAISTGVWTWFAVTYLNGSASLYRNGALIATSSGTYIPGATSLGLDADVGGVDYYWGNVDDTRIYNSALSSSAILSVYQSSIGPTPSPTSSSAPTSTSTPTASVTPAPGPTPSPTSTSGPISTPTPTPTATLAHWWKFTDGSGTVAADSADSAPGTLAGSASWVTGVDEQYAISVGTSSYNGGGSVTFPTNLPTAFTFSFWVEPSGYTNALGGGGAYNNVLFGGGQYATNGFRSGFTSAGTFSFWTTESGGTLTLNDTTAISTGVWTWFAVTYLNGSASLYRNGALIATSSGTYIPGATSLGLDADVGGVDYYWGNVDDTRIYNSALSSSAILSVYQSSIGPTPSPTSSSAPTSTSTPTASVTPAPGPTPSPTSTSGPISTPTPTPTATLAHWWKFTDGSGTVAADSADSAPGTLAGSASWVTGVDEQYAISVGTSSYNGGGSVTFPTNLPTAFTFSFWVEPSGYTNALGGGGAYNNVLFGGGQYATNGFRSGFTSAGTFSFWTTESGGTLTLNDTTAISTGVWTWFAVTYLNGSASLYRNGALIATSSGTYIPGATSLGLDADVGGVDYYWGNVDDTRIYNSALSSSAILSVYQSMVPAPTPIPG